MHTNDDLRGVSWLVGSDGTLIPYSVCDHTYVEDAFENCPALMLQRIGIVNVAEITEKLIDGPRKFKKDEEVVRAVNEICRKWFSCEIHKLPYDKKCRLIPYYSRSHRTNVPQLARVFELSREEVADVLKRNGQ